MTPYPPLIVKQLLAELRREAEMNRLSRVGDQKTASLIEWKLSIAIASVIGVILLLEFIG